MSKDLDLKEKVVEASGYTIECQSPLEVSSGESFASKSFAYLIIDARYNDCLSAVMEVLVGKWHDNLPQTFESFLKDLGLDLVE